MTIHVRSISQWCPSDSTAGTLDIVFTITTMSSLHSKSRKQRSFFGITRITSQPRRKKRRIKSRTSPQLKMVVVSNVSSPLWFLFLELWEEESSAAVMLKYTARMGGTAYLSKAAARRDKLRVMCLMRNRNKTLMDSYRTSITMTQSTWTP